MFYYLPEKSTVSSHFRGKYLPRKKESIHIRFQLFCKYLSHTSGLHGGLVQVLSNVGAVVLPPGSWVLDLGLGGQADVDQCIRRVSNQKWRQGWRPALQGSHRKLPWVSEDWAELWRTGVPYWARTQQAGGWLSHTRAGSMPMRPPASSLVWSRQEVLHAHTFCLFLWKEGMRGMAEGAWHQDTSKPQEYKAGV